MLSSEQALAAITIEVCLFMSIQTENRVRSVK